MSDLHFGAGRSLDDEPEGAGIRELVERIQPELVIASGDLTHGGRAAEHETAARYLESLGRPLLVIPGNHDIPPFSPARFTRTWRDFNRHWQTTSPVYSSPTIQAIGLNSVRPLGYQRGRLRAQPTSSGPRGCSARERRARFAWLRSTTSSPGRRGGCASCR